MIELALRSTVILIAAWALARLMPRATAATRHLVWHGAVVAILIAPLASIANVPKVPLVPGVPVPAVRVPTVSEILRPPAIGSVSSSPTPISHPSFGAPPNVSGARTFGALGTLGTFAAGLWFAAGWVAAGRLTRRATPAPLAWQLELSTLRERLRIRREVSLGIIAGQSSPLATGVFRASILLPQTSAAWTDDRRRAVLLHELAHIKRGDCRVQLMAQAACALYWFNPLVWMTASALRSERERACDDDVLRLGARASSYASHLLDIARELRPTLRPSAALAMARPSDLEGRLLSVLADGRARVPARATRWIIIGVLTATTAVALTATSQSPVPATMVPPVIEFGPQYNVANDVPSSSQEVPPPRARAEATLQTSADPQDRERATLALAFTSGKDVIPALLKALADPDSQVREKAAIGLALRRDDRVVEPLIAAMQDADSQVREKVAIALGTSGDPRAHDVLVRALGDPDSQVREKATSALVLSGLTRKH